MRIFSSIYSTTAVLICAGSLVSCQDKKEGKVQIDPVSIESSTDLAPVTVDLHTEHVSAKTVVVPEGEVGFNSHVQQILSEYCYHCHGPDSSTRAPKDNPLRLDIEEEAFRKRVGVTLQPIVKGDPAKSDIVARMRTHDPDKIMPPPESHKKMTEAEIQIIEKWISQGANYEKHWSFIAPEKEEVNVQSDWVKNPIDHYVLVKLEENGLEPNPDEEAFRLLRRLSQDITGLPPHRDDVVAFEKAYSEDKDKAVSDEVDRLMQTDGYAEHMARHWLDAVRYGDTHGLHVDSYRAIWPYRDWVIDAFKENKPFDEFTIEQVGGDLIPNPTLDQLVATGYNRCLPTTGEGGAIPEEYEAIYAQDRTDTTSAVWLGLTMGCAACHDHKFDPISQKDNFSFTAFFRNSTMSAMDNNRHQHKPSVFVPAKSDRSLFENLTAERQQVEAKLEERRQAADAEFQAWLEDPQLANLGSLQEDLELHLPLESPEKDAVFIRRNGHMETVPTKVQTIPGPIGEGLVLNSANIQLPDVANFNYDETVSFGGWFYTGQGWIEKIISRADGKGLQFDRTFSSIATLISTGGEKRIMHFPGTDYPPKEQWFHYWVNYDGSQEGRKQFQVFINGKASDDFFKEYSDTGSSISESPLKIGLGHAPKEDLEKSTGLQDFRFYRKLLTPTEVLALSRSAATRKAVAKLPSERSEEDRAALRDHYFTHIDEVARELVAKRESLDERLLVIERRGSPSLVMQEKTYEEPHAHILNRGVYSDKLERVGAAVPEVLPPLPEGEKADRLALGKWLVSRENPLSARVTMNRFWYYFFGQGLVSSNADFGIMGSRPSHPKLLDWLAVEFMDSGWDVRHMVKLITTSATYRQSAVVSAEKKEKDGSNALLSRGPRYRMDAEQIRDLALASSGLLDQSMGGPPVKPYQPKAVWESVAMVQSNTRFYKQDQGKKLYRRSLYTFWKRQAPLPSLEIFNAPTRDVFCVQRDRTNTPLQAFVTLNDTQFVESARNLAQLALTTETDFRKRLNFISKELLSRTFSDDEVEILRVNLEENLAHYRNAPDEAEKLSNVGESETPEGIDFPLLAAWTITASQVFNLDENLTK